MENQNNEKKNILFFRPQPPLFVLIVVILLLASFVVWVGIDIQNKVKEGRYIGQEIEAKNTITVSETGEIYTKPDLVLTTFSVITEAKQVSEAMSENTKKMNAVIDFVKSQGVEDKDLKTTSFNIYPRYEYQKIETDIYPYPPGKRVLVGYEVNQSLEVKIRNMEKIGEILQGATDTGANQVGDLQFTIDKQDELKGQARKQAIEKAKAKAEEIASKLGVNLVRIVNFSESSPMSYYYGLREAVPMVSGGGEVPQIETGENKIQVQVTITYEIN